MKKQREQLNNREKSIACSTSKERKGLYCKTFTAVINYRVIKAIAKLLPP
jgi:hypothetical protein